MIYKIALKFSKFFFLLIFSLAIVFFGNSSIEIFFVNNKFEDFKARGTIVPELYEEDTNTNYYRVVKEYDYEDTSRLIVNFEENHLGSKSDVIITNRNPMRHTPELNFPMNFLANKYFLGHASINDDNRKIYETLGNTGSSTYDGVAYQSNNWLREARVNSANTEANKKSNYINEFPILVALRIKNTNEEQREKMMDYAEAQLGKGYNYSFVFNRDKTFYCTDLVSRSIAAAGINTNYDHLATTGNDLILSDNLYIIFFREVYIKDGVKHIDVYYLDE